MAISTAKVIIMNRDTRTFHSNTLLRLTISVCILLMLIVVAAAMPPVPQTTDDNLTSSEKIIFSGLQYHGWIDNIHVRQYASPEPTADLLQKGDLNGDGILTPADAAIALRLAATGARNPAADMSGDGKVTSLDALMILQATVDSTKRKENRSAVIETSIGTMTAELYGQRAPNTTENFIELAESGFYDGLIFHRVIDDFVIQGGCPKGDGTGGSGKTIELEIHPDLTHVDGAIAMARSQHPDSASSQFYICNGAQHFLDGNYAVFGKVIDGMDVVRAIAEVATDSQDKPIDDVVIIKISIIDRE